MNFISLELPGEEWPETRLLGREKRQKTGWKGVQKQLASERSEPSRGLGKGKGCRIFPSQVTRSARLAR